MLRLAMYGIFMSTALSTSVSVFAAPLQYDCDVPPDHYSSISQEFGKSAVEVRGVVQVYQMRSGNNLPVAGARIADKDGKNSLGFQLVAQSPRAEQFDIVLNVFKNGELHRYSAGQIPIKSAISFSLLLDGVGKANFTIGNKSVTADFVPLESSKGMVFCSTAQFKFTDLVFLDGEGLVNSARP